MRRRALNPERIARELLRRYPDRQVPWGELQRVADDLRVSRRRVEGVATHLRMLVVGADAWILSWVSDHGPASTREIAAGTGYSREAVNKAVRALEAQGQVHYERGTGPGNPGRVALAAAAKG